MEKAKKERLKKKLTAIAEEKNNGEFGELYDFEVTEDKDGYIVLIDKTEDSYYEAWMLKDFNKAVEAEGCYLECECPGRYIVAE